ncbi:MAG TPA: amidohydrolase [Armatimonadota bacterium]|nr:amidohydrolase [Armatimonadota bacterium]
MTADLILKNGRFFTLSPECPWTSAVAIKDGRIVALGDEALGLDGPKRDLEGRTVVPGFTDSHIHLIYYGNSKLRWADLGGCRSISEIQDRLRKHAEKRPSEWILGIGFDHEILAERRFPTRHDLDEVSRDAAGASAAGASIPISRDIPICRDKPVFIVRLCGHACVANSKAIELAGAEKLPYPGRETGLFTENDPGPIWLKIPDTTFEQTVEATLYAANQARATGITCAHCLINSMDDLQAIRHLHGSGKLPIRFYVQVSYEMFAKLKDEGFKSGMGDDMMRIGSAKIFADGSMGASTAALTEDFLDSPVNRGILLHTDEQLAEMVRNVHLAGWQAAIHAIGDRAVGQAVDAIEAALNETGESNLVRRHRVEHASILSEELVERMARLKIVAAVQPQFVITDFWTINRVGPERYRWSYPFKTMMEKGIPMSLGSDCPVERLDAFELIYRAVNRDEYSPNERLSVEEVIRLYALGGAHASFQESVRGSLEPGKLADIVILDRDIFNIPASEIAECRAEQVLVSGR